MPTVSEVLDEALRLPADEGAELAGRLLDTVEELPGISIDDIETIERRAADARARVAGVPWADVKIASKR